MSSAVKKIASRWDAVSDENVAVLLRTQTLRIYIFVSSNYNIAYPIQRLQLFAAYTNPEGLHPSIRLPSRSTRPQRGRISQHQQNGKEKVAFGLSQTRRVCIFVSHHFAIVDPGGVASHGIKKTAKKKSNFFAECPNPEDLHPCIKPTHSPLPQMGRIFVQSQTTITYPSVYDFFAVCPNPQGLHPFIRLPSRSPRPQRGRISQHQQNGIEKIQQLCRVPKPRGFASLYKTNPQSSTPDRLHPCAKPKHHHLSQRLRLFCSMPKPAGFAYLYLTTSQSSTPAGSHLSASTKRHRKNPTTLQSTQTQRVCILV
jgi:hypothetical protein